VADSGGGDCRVGTCGTRASRVFRWERCSKEPQHRSIKRRRDHIANRRYHDCACRDDGASADDYDHNSSDDRTSSATNHCPECSFGSAVYQRPWNGIDTVQHR
jgi:hypothetical protein